RQARQPSRRRAQYRARAGAWTLAPTGRAEAAFAWKAGLQSVRVVDPRSLARLAAIVFALVMVATSFGRANGLAAVLGIFSLVGAGFTILMAPQVLRIDLRQDLQHL